MAKKTATLLKDPDSKRIYTVNWSEWLDDDDIIVASTWTIEAGLLQPYSSFFTDTKTHVWLSGGAEGSTYRAINHITTQNNFEEDWVFIIQVEDEF